MRRLRVLTWHVHGSYLYYLSSVGHDVLLPRKRDGSPGYSGRTASFAWPDNVLEVEAEQVARLDDIDVVLYQSRHNYEHDRFALLSERQRRLPQIYLEHDPPREHPTDTRHPVQDPNVLVVHVTAFNQLMWDNGPAPTTVIEHGVVIPASVRYSGHLERGLVVCNHLARRGRRLGADIFTAMRRELPLDLVGMGHDEIEGGLREVPPMEMAAFAADYRFFFHPIRYTSLGLAVCEAMMVGLPIVGLATTEMVTVVENGVSGYLTTEPRRLVESMRSLLSSPAEARRLGLAAQRVARERFDIRRFARDWDEVLRAAAGVSRRREVSSAARGSAYALQRSRPAHNLTQRLAP